MLSVHEILNSITVKDLGVVGRPQIKFQSTLRGSS